MADADPKPWVSILTPVYNGWEFLEECAMSVFQQELQCKGFGSITWEWWIGINGHGSTGGAAYQKALQIRDLFNRYYGHAGVIHVVNLPEAKSKVQTLNILAGAASGEWVAVLDCDDTWDRRKLLAQRAAAGAAGPEIGVIGTWCYYFGDFKSDGPVLPRGIVTGRHLMKGNPIVNSSALIRRPLARWEDRFGVEDYDLWFRIAAAGYVFYVISYRLVHHRIHNASAFNGKGRQDPEGLRVAWLAARPDIFATKSA